MLSINLLQFLADDNVVRVKDSRLGRALRVGNLKSALVFCIARRTRVVANFSFALHNLTIINFYSYFGGRRSRRFKIRVFVLMSAVSLFADFDTRIIYLNCKKITITRKRPLNLSLCLWLMFAIEAGSQRKYSNNSIPNRRLISVNLTIITIKKIKNLQKFSLCDLQARHHIKSRRIHLLLTKPSKKVSHTTFFYFKNYFYNFNARIFIYFILYNN